MIKKIIFLGAAVAMSSSYCLRVAVFCSADDKVSDRYKQSAYELGKELGRKEYGLITGGSKTGLMKEIVDGYANTAADTKQLYGVLPQVLAPYNVQHPTILKEHCLWVETMYKRLERFHELSDVIVVLPGGFGTLHELMDFLVHNQFALDKKQVILINTDGYWDCLLAQFQRMIDEKLLAEKHRALLICVPSVAACIERLEGTGNVQGEQGLQSHYWQK